MKLTTFIECAGCGGHAVAVQGSGERPVCMECIDQEGPPHRYVCSMDGCGNQPVILAVVDEGGRSSVLVCERHFSDIKGAVSTFLEVPAWLTDGNGFLAGDGGVVFRFEM